MTDAVTISLIGAVGSFLAAVMSLFNNALGRRNEKHIAETKEAMNVLEKNTNSIKDELVKVTGESEYAKGVKIGTESVIGPKGERGEQGPPGPPAPRGKA